MDLEKSLIAALADGAVCEYVLNTPAPLRFNLTRLPVTVNVNRPLYMKVDPGPPLVRGPAIAQAGRAASKLSVNPIIQSIQMTVTSGANGSYSGYWVVRFSPAGGAAGSSIANSLVVESIKLTINACGGSSASSLTPPFVYGWRRAWGGAGIIASSGYTPQTFSEVFTSSGGGGWGIGCQKGWRLASCALTGGGDKDRNISTASDGTTWCASDNEEAVAGLVMSIACCKAQ